MKVDQGWVWQDSNFHMLSLENLGLFLLVQEIKHFKGCLVWASLVDELIGILTKVQPAHWPTFPLNLQSQNHAFFVCTWSNLSDYSPVRCVS